MQNRNKRAICTCIGRYQTYKKELLVIVIRALKWLFRSDIAAGSLISSWSPCSKHRHPPLLPCSALKPCRGTREEPVTNWSSRALLSSSKSSTAFQNHFTMLLSGVQCFNLVFAFQSLTSIFPSPQMMSCKFKIHLLYYFVTDHYKNGFGARQMMKKWLWKMGRFYTKGKL